MVIHRKRPPTLSAFAPYRAPTGDGEALILPGLDQVPALLAENRRRQTPREQTPREQAPCEQAPCDFLLPGHPSSTLRAAARQQLLRDALHYTSRYRDVDASVIAAAESSPAIVMAGHQPTLFHPGVWFKNFALDAMVRRLPAAHAVAVNLVIDNDVAAGTSIRVPHLDATTGHLVRQAVPYDAAGGGVPYEQMRIADRQTFDHFDQRVASSLAGLIDNPLVSRLWPHARAAAGRCENVSCALAAARHALEAEVGLQTLELPLSVVCRSEPFAAFVLSICQQAERFRKVYNCSSIAYRAANGIRSTAHPVPNLGRQDDWIEVPFWIYSDAEPQRRAAWVRVSAGKLEISDRNAHSVQLDWPLASDAARQLQQLGGPAFKLRPRALTTTMFARLLLSDLFVHGIGGAKYDELGDQIVAEFFGLQPPELMVVSATVRLPLDAARFLPTAEQFGMALPMTLADTRNLIRQTIYAPERFAGHLPLSAELCQAKRELIATPPAAADAKRWHDRLAAINRELSGQLEPLSRLLLQRLPEVRRAESVTSVLRSREHSFCLFPLEQLTRCFAGLLR